jgi:hypothetical protein
MAKLKTKKPKHARDFENMNEDQIIQQFNEDLTASESFQRPFFDKFVRFYKLYRSFIDAENIKENRSNLFIPYCFHIVETVTPKLVTAMFASRPYVQTMPLGVSDNAIR